MRSGSTRAASSKPGTSFAARASALARIDARRTLRARIDQRLRARACRHLRARARALRRRASRRLYLATIRAPSDAEISPISTSAIAASAPAASCVLLRVLRAPTRARSRTRVARARARVLRRPSADSIAFSATARAMRCASSFVKAARAHVGIASRARARHCRLAAPHRSRRHHHTTRAMRAPASARLR